MIDWYVEAIAPAGDDPWAMLGIQPTSDDQRDQLATRLRHAGCKLLSTREYLGVIWPETRCTVTVQLVEGRPCITQMHTGATRILPVEPIGLTPMFTQALQRRRLLLALLAPGALPTYGVDRLLPAETREHLGEQFEAAVERGDVLAGYARVLDHAAPRPSAPTIRGRRW